MALSLSNNYKDSASIHLKKESRVKSISLNDIFSRIGKPVKSAELMFFCSHLSLMFEIKTPLNQALKTIENQTQNAAFKKVIQSMTKDVEEGRQLSDAMKRHPRFFNTMFTSMVKAGENGGFLHVVLEKIVEMQEKRQRLISQIKSALTYPAFLCILGFLAIIFIMVSVLPKFTGLFEGKESVLPFTTLCLMNGSSFLRSYWWLCILSCGGLLTGIKIFKDSKHGKALIEWFLVSGPLVSNLCTKIYTNELLRILGNLIESKVSFIEALEVTRGTIRNSYFRDFIDKTIKHMENGGKFSDQFVHFPYIMESVKQMVVTGEDTGNLSTAMLRLNKHYDLEIEQDLKKLTALIEPAALVVMGAVIGIIVSSIILPMFKLSQVIG
ncbi:type II secretion system F family protein [Candidatus Scalindua japonica]|nr:type II secretion system F family protein [Candidatus Scalindua japonica]